jgi:hypothetical protein
MGDGLRETCRPASRHETALAEVPVRDRGVSPCGGEDEIVILGIVGDELQEQINDARTQGNDPATGIGLGVANLSPIATA